MKKEKKAEEINEDEFDMNDIVVTPDKISITITAYIDGQFNNPGVVNLEFEDAEIYFNNLYKTTGYLPQYGDGLESDVVASKKGGSKYWSAHRFIVVSKQFMVDDYLEINIIVIPERVFFNKFS